METRLIDVTSLADVLSGDGIFNQIATLDAQSKFPWLTNDFAKQIDEDYYLNHSGGKWISHAYKRLIDHQDELPSGQTFQTVMARIIINRFSLSWKKIYDAINTNYSPLENYDMEQTETPNVTKTKSVKQKIETANDVYGFNSSVAIPQTKTTTDGAKLDNEETESETGTRGLTRHGNIGVTTSQQMLQSEIDLRTNFQFMNQIMNDVDSILCLLVY